MTDYQKMYQEKLTTPDRLAQQVQSGWLLGMDTATSQTPAIMTAIAEHIRNSDITGVKVQAPARCVSVRVLYRPHAGR